MQTDVSKGPQCNAMVSESFASFYRAMHFICFNEHNYYITRSIRKIN